MDFIIIIVHFLPFIAKNNKYFKFLSKSGILFYLLCRIDVHSFIYHLRSMCVGGTTVSMVLFFINIDILWGEVPQGEVLHNSSSNINNG